jgi:hypothetical protein
MGVQELATTSGPYASTNLSYWPCVMVRLWPSYVQMYFWVAARAGVLAIANVAKTAALASTAARFLIEGNSTYTSFLPKERSLEPSVVFTHCLRNQFESDDKAPGQLPRTT